MRGFVFIIKTMARVSRPLLSLGATGRIGKALIYYGGGHARAWSAQRDPKTAAQLQSRAVVGEVMGMIKFAAALDRAWLRANVSKSWHVRLTAWLSRDSLFNALALYSEWSAMTQEERDSWEAIAP